MSNECFNTSFITHILQMAERMYQVIHYKSCLTWRLTSFPVSWRTSSVSFASQACVRSSQTKTLGCLRVSWRASGSEREESWPTALGASSAAWAAHRLQQWEGESGSADWDGGRHCCTHVVYLVGFLFNLIYSCICSSSPVTDLCTISGYYYTVISISVSSQSHHSNLRNVEFELLWS